MKKYLVLILVILLSQITYASAFPDVSDNHNNNQAITWLAEEGIIQGYPDGTFGPNEPINRAELMKIIVNMKAAVDDNYKNCFPDVTNEWYAKYVCYAQEKKWIQGYPDRSFHPENNVNRAEAIKIIINALLPNSEWSQLTAIENEYVLPADFDKDAWYIDYARIAIVRDYVDKAHTTETPDSNINYYPSGDMSRKEVAEMIFRIQKQ